MLVTLWNQRRMLPCILIGAGRSGKGALCVFIEKQEEALLATAQALEPAKHTLQQGDLCTTHYAITIFLH